MKIISGNYVMAVEDVRFKDELKNKDVNFAEFRNLGLVRRDDRKQ